MNTADLAVTPGFNLERRKPASGNVAILDWATFELNWGSSVMCWGAVSRPHADTGDRFTVGTPFARDTVLTQ